MVLVLSAERKSLRRRIHAQIRESLIDRAVLRPGRTMESARKARLQLARRQALNACVVARKSCALSGIADTARRHVPVVERQLCSRAVVEADEAARLIPAGHCAGRIVSGERIGARRLEESYQTSGVTKFATL